MTENRIFIGKIASVHGVKGLVKLLLSTEDYTLGETQDFLTDNGVLPITLKSKHGKHVLAAVEGVEDRTTAEALRGTDLYILGEDKESHLIGQEVFNENGAPIGTILSIQNFGASDLLEIKPTGGEESFLLPLTDEFVEETQDCIVVIDYETYLALNSGS